MNVTNNLHKAERLARGSKLGRLVNNPIKYFKSQWHKTVTYPANKKSKLVQTTIFTGDKMSLLIPAGMDIYLTGIKSHDSEIRLCKFLINTLKPKNTFIDIGAHLGFFTLLASNLVGNNGRVFSFEAAKSIHEILAKNCSKCTNVNVFNQAISNQTGTISFYEFPILYSEYNSVNIEQYKNYDWFSKNQPTKNNIKTDTLSNIFNQHELQPNVIKIDVEGAEKLVIEGLLPFLAKPNNRPIIVMEYLFDERDNNEHKQAANLLLNNNYAVHLINSKGETEKINFNDLKHFKSVKNQSDNIVFIRNK